MTRSQAPASSSKSKVPPKAARSSNFKVIFESALKRYQETTHQDLTVDPLFSQLQVCDTPAAVLTILQDQVDQITQSRSGDERLKDWINPTINVLYAFSAALGGGVGLVNVITTVGDIALIPILQVFPAANAICAGAGVLLSVSALVCSLVPALVTSGVHRQPRTSKQAKMSSSMSSSASVISFGDSKSTPISHQHRK